MGVWVQGRSLELLGIAWRFLALVLGQTLECWDDETLGINLDSLELAGHDWKSRNVGQFRDAWLMKTLSLPVGWLGMAS